MLKKLLFPHSTPFRKAKALYACKAEHDSELSFAAGTVFDNGEFLVPSQRYSGESKSIMGVFKVAAGGACVCVCCPKVREQQQDIWKPGPV